MRVLQVNKFGRPTSGADKYFLALARALSARGNTVATLSMAPCDDVGGTSYTVPAIDFHELSGVRDRAAAARTVLRSPDAEHEIDHAIRDFKPDLVHFHNIAHHLSSAVVEAAKVAGLPTVMTAHDSKLICPAYLSLRDGSPCAKCHGHSVTAGVKHRCLHGSLAWRVLGAVDARRTRRRHKRAVPDLVICPSQHLASMFEASWLATTSTTLRTVSNPVAAPPQRTTRGPKSGGIYVGRLSYEKGVDVAIRASKASNVALVIVGDG